MLLVLPLPQLGRGSVRLHSGGKAGWNCRHAQRYPPRCSFVVRTRGYRTLQGQEQTREWVGVDVSMSHQPPARFGIESREGDVVRRRRVGMRHRVSHHTVARGREWGLGGGGLPVVACIFGGVYVCLFGWLWGGRGDHRPSLGERLSGQTQAVVRWLARPRPRPRPLRVGCVLPPGRPAAREGGGQSRAVTGSHSAAPLGGTSWRSLRRHRHGSDPFAPVASACVALPRPRPRAGLCSATA